MRVAVIMGYILSAAFAYCGVVNLVVYILDGGTSNFLRFTARFPLVAWPLAVALFLYLLIQMVQLQMTRMQERRTFAPNPVPGEPVYGAPSPYLDGMTSDPQGEQPRQEVYFRMQPPPAFPETAESAPSLTEEETAGDAADNLLPLGEEIPEEFTGCTGEGDDGVLPGAPKRDASEGEKMEKLSFFRVE